MKKRQTAKRTDQPGPKVSQNAANTSQTKEVSSKQTSSKPAGPSAVSKSRKSTLIGYVHKLSPPKRNRRDTMNYSTFGLQTETGKVEDGLCFSSAKRILLEEKQLNRTAVKLSAYTLTSLGEKSS